MKTQKIITVLFFLLSLFSRAENRTALIMGSWEYKNSPNFKRLVGVEIDLALMKKSLEKQGFEVHVIKNPSVGIARGAIDQFGRILKKRKGVGLFYFSGHGCEIGGHNYLIPNNNNIQIKDDVVNNALDTQRVLNRMQEAGIETKILFLDCCRVPFGFGKSKFSPFKAEGAFIGYATGSGKTTEIRKNGSIYTKYLAKSIIASPKVSISDMHTLLTGEIKKKHPELGRNQLPYHYSGGTKIFYFAKTGNRKPIKTTENMKVVAVSPIKSIIKLNNGIKINHLKLKNKITRSPLTKSSKVYRAMYAGDEGLVALQFINGSYVAGSFFIPKSGKEINLYGHNHSKGKILLSLWESGSPLDGGQLLKVIKDGNITWSARMSSGNVLSFTREKSRIRGSETSLYSGEIGSSDVDVSLFWQKDGRVNGNYKSRTSGKTYKLSGDNLLKGFLYLEEFTKGKLSARIFLHRNDLKKGLQWKGTLYNINGPRREVSFLKKN